MTISTETSEVVYAGNGLTSTFPFTFPIFAASHLVVTHIASDGTETPQVEATNYTLTWTGPGKTGSVNRIRIVLGVPEVFPLPTGESYRLERTVPLTQQVDLVNNSRVRIDQMEKGLDYTTQIAQQIDRKAIATQADVVVLQAESADHEDRIDWLETAPSASSPVSPAMQPVVAAAMLADARDEMGVTGEIDTVNDRIDSLDITGKAIAMALIFG